MVATRIASESEWRVDVMDAKDHGQQYSTTCASSFFTQARGIAEHLTVPSIASYPAIVLHARDAFQGASQLFVGVGNARMRS